MLKFKSIKDVKRIATKGLISTKFAEYLHNYIGELCKSLGEGVPVEKFNLSEHGYIILLSDRSECDDLEDVGLEDGLLDSCPEFVNIIKLPDGEKYYQIGILYNNEYMMIFIYPANLNDDVTEFLDEYVTDDCIKEVG